MNPIMNDLIFHAGDIKEINFRNEILFESRILNNRMIIAVFYGEEIE